MVTSEWFAVRSPVLPVLTLCLAFLSPLACPSSLSCSALFPLPWCALSSSLGLPFLPPLVCLSSFSFLLPSVALSISAFCLALLPLFPRAVCCYHRAMHLAEIAQVLPPTDVRVSRTKFVRPWPWLQEGSTFCYFVVTLCHRSGSGPLVSKMDSASGCGQPIAGELNMEERRGGGGRGRN